VTALFEPAFYLMHSRQKAACGAADSEQGAEMLAFSEASASLGTPMLIPSVGCGAANGAKAGATHKGILVPRVPKGHDSGATMVTSMLAPGDQFGTGRPIVKT
jgi:hypothetical protein